MIRYFKSKYETIKKTKIFRLGRKWAFLITFFMGIVTVIRMYNHNSENKTVKQSNYRCVKIYLNPKAAIDLDSFSTIKFDFKNPWITKTDSTAILLYKLVLFDTAKNTVLPLPGQDFTVSNLTKRANEMGLLGAYIFMKEIELILIYQNTGQTSQYYTTVESYLWKRHQWIKTEDEAPKEIYEIPSNSYSMFSMPARYPGEWELPQRFYIKKTYRFTNAFGERKTKSEIILFNPRDTTFSVINGDEFKNWLKEDSINAVRKGVYPNY